MNPNHQPDQGAERSPKEERPPLAVPPPTITPPRSPLADLSAPRGQTRGTPVDRTVDAKLPVDESAIAGSQAKHRSLGSMLRTIFGSPIIWSGAGSTAVCVGTSDIGVIGFIAVTLWSVKNQLTPPRPTPQSTQPTAQGYGGLVHDIFRSPGLSTVATLVVQLSAAIEAAARTMYLEASVFAVMVSARVASTRIINLDFWASRQNRTGLERWWQGEWSKIPARLQNVLCNPAPWFALATNVLVTSGMKFEKLAGQPAVLALLFGGLIVNTVAVGWGLTPAFRQKPGDQHPSGRPAQLNGLGNLLLGIASVSQGSLAVGIASLFWAPSGYFWGRLMNLQRSSGQQLSDTKNLTD